MFRRAAAFVLALVSLLASPILLAPVATPAQPAVKAPRVALFSLAFGPNQEGINAFREGLRQLGYVEGRNITIELRSAEGNSERLSALAAELVRLKIDIIVATGSDAIAAAQQATKTIPIVMAIGAEPVAAGFVAGLARPGENITGFTTLVEGLSAKRLQLLKEAVPKVTRIAVLWRRANPTHQLILKEIDGAARALGVQLHLAEARDSVELDGAFSAMTKSRVGAVLVLGDRVLDIQARRIVDLAARAHLPTMLFAKRHVEAGGLMSYATDQNDLQRGAATFVDKILKGAKPGDLPVQQPTKFELVINLTTAKALGLTIPQTLVQRADRVIE